MTEALLALLQVTDGLFPTGAFAHSLGLETYAQRGIVRDADSLHAFVRAHLEGGAGPMDAVAVACASRFAVGGDIDGCVALDERLDAMKWPPETRAASRQMGRHAMRAVAAMTSDAMLAELGDRIVADRTPGHHAMVFGAATGRAGVGVEPAAAAFLYATAAMLVNAGLRLISLGQIEAQQVLAALRSVIAPLARAAAAGGIEDMWSFAPGLDIASIEHAALPMRLFRS